MLTLPQSLTEINAHNAKDHGNALPCALGESSSRCPRSKGVLRKHNKGQFFVDFNYHAKGSKYKA